jgi:hypothetical protein
MREASKRLVSSSNSSCRVNSEECGADRTRRRSFSPKAALLHFKLTKDATSSSARLEIIGSLVQRSPLWASDVRVGSFSDFGGRNHDVRFPPDSDQLRTSPEVRSVPKAEVPGPYSITSLASASRLGDTVTPSCFAVLRFMTSS